MDYKKTFDCLEHVLLSGKLEDYPSRHESPLREEPGADQSARCYHWLPLIEIHVIVITNKLAYIRKYCT